MSITPTLVEFPTPAYQGQPPAVKGYLWMPEGHGPFPAVVYHGSHDFLDGNDPVGPAFR